MRDATRIVLCSALWWALPRVPPAQCAEAPPPASAPNYPLVAQLDCSGEPGAYVRWTPREGTAAPDVVVTGSRKAVRLRCNFEGTKIARAYIDASARIDLSDCQGLQFRVFCSDPAPVKTFHVHLRSGQGWYSAAFRPDDPSAWNTIAVDKSAMQPEGSPAGWDKVDTIRFSAWRGADRDTEVLIADVGLFGAGAPIVIVRADSIAGDLPSEMGSVRAAVGRVAGFLRDLNIGCLVVGDGELTDAVLEKRTIVILPYNTRMPDRPASVVARFLKGGGKLISFYVLPDRIAPLTDIRQLKHMPAKRPGQFATIHAVKDLLPGLPPVIEQASWNIFRAAPASRKSRVAARWHDDRGKDTGEAAVIVSRNCIHMTHILLSDDPADKQTMLLSMVGHFLPGAWRDAAGRSLELADVFGPFKAPGKAMPVLRKSAAGKTAMDRLLDNAAALGNRAGASFRAGKFVDAFSFSEQSHDSLVEAYCMLQEPGEPEFRAFWCHNAFGVAGKTWDQTVKALADSGFTAVFPNMGWAGAAHYNSAVLPVSAEASARGDQVRECLAACAKYGIQCHVWKICWQLGGSAPAAFVERMKREGRLQTDFNGNTDARWLCPSDPANLKLELDSLRELARNYEIDGVQLDYIRYPNANSCFCAGCRTRFEKEMSVSVRNWPADVRNRADLNAKWLEFRRRNIAALVAEASRSCRSIRPGVRISAAVFTDWVSAKDEVAQDWKNWCEKGYLDFVCPMDYTANLSEFEEMARKQKEWAGSTPCYPGLGLSLWPPRDRICRLIDQVRATRRLETGGFAVFDLRYSETEEILPLCGAGLTRR